MNVFRVVTSRSAFINFSLAPNPYRHFAALHSGFCIAMYKNQTKAGMERSKMTDGTPRAASPTSNFTL